MIVGDVEVGGSIGSVDISIEVGWRRKEEPERRLVECICTHTVYTALYTDPLGWGFRQEWFILSLE